MAKQPKTNVEIGGYKYAKTSLTIGKDEKGNPIRKIFYGLTKTEAENKKKEYINNVEKGLNPDLSNQSLSQAMYAWLWNIERYSGNKSSSFERYEGIYRNYIKNSDIGKLTIKDIKKMAIQKYYNNLTSSGKSYSQIKNLHKLLNKFLGYAETEGYIIKNPCKGTKIPKSGEKEIQDDDDKVETFSKDELNRIINAAKNKKIKYIIMFALFTGIREGELLALEKADITDKIVKINKTVRNGKVFSEEEVYDYETNITKPKTKTSRREVPIPDVLKPELRKLEKIVAEEKLKLGHLYQENNLLFPSETGTYIDAKNLIKSWQRLFKKNDVPYKKFHTLRHTYATRLFENGASILTVSRLLGHSSIKTTEIYTHVLQNIKEKEVECLNNMLL